MGVVLAVAEALERGSLRGVWARRLSEAWARAASRSVVRRLGWPEGVRVVAIGGSTLGGSGKTPLAIACAAELAAAGARVAFVGHGYRAALRGPRVVSPADALADVGDEALLAARALDGAARVVIGRRRADAIALAARDADVLVLDGVGQTAPVRASLALLALDADEPWGRARATPPAGDLRAPAAVLLGACDAAVVVGEGAGKGRGAGGMGVAIEGGREVWAAAVVARGAYLAGERGGAIASSFRSWAELGELRVGLFTALARPDRLVRALTARGVRVAALVRVRDHGPMRRGDARACRRAAERAALDLWVASPKCALHALTYGDPGELGGPLATLEYALALAPSLRARLRALARDPEPSCVLP